AAAATVLAEHANAQKRLCSQTGNIEELAAGLSRAAARGRRLEVLLKDVDGNVLSNFACDLNIGRLYRSPAICEVAKLNTLGDRIRADSLLRQRQSQCGSNDSQAFRSGIHFHVIDGLAGCGSRNADCNTNEWNIFVTKSGRLQPSRSKVHHKRCGVIGLRTRGSTAAARAESSSR